MKLGYLGAKSGEQWDGKINDEDEEQFLDWFRELAELKSMALKRRSSDKSDEKNEGR